MTIFDDLGEAVYLAALALLAVARFLTFNQRPVSDEQRNFDRVCGGAGGLALCVYLFVRAEQDRGGVGHLVDFVARNVNSDIAVSFSVFAWFVVLAISLIRLVIGASAPPSRRDMMRFWGQVPALLIVILLLISGAYFPASAPHARSVNLGLASWYMFWLGCSLTGLVWSLRTVNQSKLPEPATNPDNIMAGPATMKQAHDALRGSSSKAPPRFKI